MKKLLPLLTCTIISLFIGAARIGPPAYAPKQFLVGGWGHPDNLGNHWLLVWVAERISRWEQIIHNDQYYLPYGDYPWIAGNGTEGFLYLPFHLLFGYPAALPIWLLSLFVAIGLAGYSLGRVIGLSRWFSLVPSAIICSTPYLAKELTAGRFSQVDIFWFVGAVASFLWLFREPKSSWKSILTCSIFSGMTAIFYWYYGFFFLLFACVVVGVALITRQKLPLKGIIISAAWAMGIALPVFWIYMINWHLIPGTGEAEFPAPEAILTSLSPSWVIFHKYGKSAVVTQSLVALFFAGRAFWKMSDDRERQREGLLGIVLILLFGLLAGGTNTPVFGWIYGSIESLQRFWWPSRHIIGVVVGVAILASVGLREWGKEFSEIKQCKWSIGLAILIPLSLYLQGDRPFQAHHSPVKFPPEVYLELAELEHDGIVQPPMNPVVCRTQAPLLFQMIHRKRMLNGHAQWVDRVRPKGWDEKIKGNQLLGSFWKFEAAEFSGKVNIREQDINELKELGVRYWVIDRELFSSDLTIIFQTYHRVSRQLFGKAIIKKEGVWVYDLENFKGEQEIEFKEWTWPNDVVRGSGTMGLRGELFDSKVLLDNEKKNLRQ